jgi:hypothetical protein
MRLRFVRGRTRRVSHPHIDRRGLVTMRAMRARRVLLVTLGLVAACSFDRHGIGSDAVIDGAGGGPDASVDAMFDANTCGHCSGSVITGCAGQPDVSCELGCSEDGGAHCKQLVPSNGVPLSVLSGVTAGLTTVGALTPPDKREYTINTDTGEILDYGDNGFPLGIPTTIRKAANGINAGIGFTTVGSVAVLAVDSLHVGAESVVYGFGSHPLVVLSRKDVLIEGTVDFSSGCYDDLGTYITTCGGPGGGVGGTVSSSAGGCAPGADGLLSHFTGGGGGGFGANGAAGGDFSNGSKGGAGGVATSCAGATLVPLQGGGGGGQGGGNDGGDGGGGGGALQITSLATITLTHPQAAMLTTEIYVAGQGGTGTPTPNSGGGGGGAGGAILLEAKSVVVHGTLAANGGGGGGGRLVGPDADGKAGTSTAVQAAGGAGDGVAGMAGHGGFGGAALGAASQGIGNVDGTGGGGGALGRVRLNTLGGTADTIGSTVSPLFTQGKIVTQ